MFKLGSVVSIKKEFHLFEKWGNIRFKVLKVTKYPHFGDLNYVTAIPVDDSGVAMLNTKPIHFMSENLVLSENQLTDQDVEMLPIGLENKLLG